MDRMPDDEALRTRLQGTARSAPAAAGTLSVSLRRPGLDAVVDVRGGAPLHAASSIKLCILISALRAFESAVEGLDSVIAGSTLRHRLTAMVTYSDNDAANVLIEHLGMDRINAEMSQVVGLSAETRLVRRMGDAASAFAGRDNTATANDLTLLLHRLRAGACLGPEGTKEALRILRLPKRGEAAEYAVIARSAPADSSSLVASKSGYIPSSLVDDYGEAAGAYVDAALVESPSGAWWCLAVAVNGCRDDEAALDVMQEVARLSWDAARAW